MTQLGDGVEEFAQALGVKVASKEPCDERCAVFDRGTRTLSICSATCAWNRDTYLRRALADIQLAE